MESFEENLGKYPYVTLAQVKDYLTISSDSFDGTLTNAINYATAVVEHYIGQQVLANNYYEVFDGGQSSVFSISEELAKLFGSADSGGSH